MSKLADRRKRQAKKAQQDGIPAGWTSIRNASAKTGIPIRTIQRWAQAGYIKARRNGPKLYIVLLDDVRRTARTIKPGRKPTWGLKK